MLSTGWEMPSIARQRKQGAQLILRACQKPPQLSTFNLSRLKMLVQLRNNQRQVIPMAASFGLAPRSGWLSDSASSARAEY